VDTNSGTKVSELQKGGGHPDRGTLGKMKVTIKGAQVATDRTLGGGIRIDMEKKGQRKKGKLMGKGLHQQT